jgi:hypothetical protein
MTSRWHRAIADADFEDGPRDYEQAVRDELPRLWSDLAEAVRMAHKGCWSVGCDNVAFRIILLSRLAGAAHWRDVRYPLLLDGTYQGLMTDAGIPHEEPGEEDLQMMRALMDRWRDAR